MFIYPWVLKFLDLESGGLFEDGTYQIFTIFSKYCMSLFL